MGASFSKSDTENNELYVEKSQTISEKMDYISTYYILTSDFKSLKKLYQKEYCDDLVILTSDIIQKQLNFQEISFLQSRVMNGENINQLKEEPMIYFSNANINKDIKKSITNEKNKSRMCIGIAKFYIKIAHVFAAIITSVNPMYSYTENGEEKQVDGNEKNNIPANAEVKIKMGGLCQRRLETLRDGHDYINIKKDEEIQVGVNLCNFKSKESLIEEPGIPELEELYYDKYDFEEGKFYAMSNKSRELYENDVKAFYEIFMNTTKVPETIRKFSDIKLRDYKNSPECQDSSAVFKRQFKDSIKNELFFEYAQNIKKMTENTELYQNSLLELINQIFVYTIDSTTGDKLVRIDPVLNMTKLENIIIEARRLIITMYLKCEEDFNEGVKIFRSIADTMAVYKLREEIYQLERTENLKDYLNEKYTNESQNHAVIPTSNIPPPMVSSNLLNLPKSNPINPINPETIKPDIPPEIPQANTYAPIYVAGPNINLNNIQDTRPDLQNQPQNIEINQNQTDLNQQSQPEIQNQISNQEITKETENPEIQESIQPLNESNSNIQEPQEEITKEPQEEITKEPQEEITKETETPEIQESIQPLNESNFNIQEPQEEITKEPENPEIQESIQPLNESNSNAQPQELNITLPVPNIQNFQPQNPPTPNQENLYQPNTTLSSSNSKSSILNKDTLSNLIKKYI